MRWLPPLWWLLPRNVKVTGDDVGKGCGCMIGLLLFAIVLVILSVIAANFGKLGAFIACVIAAPILIYYGAIKK